MKNQTAKKIKAFGKNNSIAQWAELTGIKASTLKSRLTRAKDDKDKIKAAFTNGASEEFLASVAPKRKKREEQIIQVDLTGGSVTVTRHVNNAITVIDSEGKALNAAKTLSEINAEKGLNIEPKNAEGKRILNTRSFGKKVIEALAS